MKYLFLAVVMILASPAVAEEPETLRWDDLLPEGELELLNQLYAEQNMTPLLGHSPDDYEEFDMSMPIQIGTFNVVEELDGKVVRIPGFVLPLEYAVSGHVSEFLLVPYFGACIHTPPPPPNQLVYVTAEKPANLSQQWDAIWAVGVLRTKSHINDLGDTAYTLELQRWETYGG